MSKEQSLKLLETCKRKGINQAEVYLATVKSTKVEVLNGKIESIDNLSETGLALRIIKDEKLGFAYTTDFDEALLSDLLTNALNSAQCSHNDPNFFIPKPAPYERIKTFDREISDLKVKDKTEMALQIESAAYASDPRVKKTEKVYFADAETKVEIFNSNGLDATYNANHCGGYCDVIAEVNNQAESGFSFAFTTKRVGLDCKKIGADAAHRACELLAARVIPAQKLPLILDPFVGTQLLETIAALFSSDAVQKGKSLLMGKMGSIVASKLLTIIDDGRLKDCLGSSPFDDEGVPTQQTVLIENGMLNNYLYNAYTAKKEGKVSTGNGKRASYKSLPEVGISNIYIKPGAVSAENLLSKLSKGLYVTRVMGMHTINPVSGDFSIGAAGLMVENGKRTFPVRGITIAGNLLELLKSIEDIGNDLTFFANIGCPSLLISNIAVSG